MVLDALAAGHCFVGNDLPAATSGFQFSAQSKFISAIMGDEIKFSGPVTLQVKLPSAAEIRLVRNGRVVRSAHSEAMVYITDEPGIFRVEVLQAIHGEGARLDIQQSNLHHLKAPQKHPFRLQYNPFKLPRGLPSAPGSPTVNVREHIPRKGGFPYASL